MPKIHHSDQGIQYAADAYIDLLKSRDIQISMAAIGKAEENDYAVRVTLVPHASAGVCAIKEEEVALSEYLDFADAVQQSRDNLSKIFT